MIQILQIWEQGIEISLGFAIAALGLSRVIWLMSLYGDGINLAGKDIKSKQIEEFLLWFAWLFVAIAFAGMVGYIGL